MTERAPPARTTLTDEYRLRGIASDLARHLEHTGAANEIYHALAAARAEGRLGGLEEALGEVGAEMSDPPDDTQETTWGFLNACHRIDGRIQRLATDALKAPKTPEIPAGTQG